MRTTIELSQTHRQMLSQLAQMRGYRGYSKIIKEAVGYYLDCKKFSSKEQSQILKLKGSWKNKELNKDFQTGLAEVRKNWHRSWS